MRTGTPLLMAALVAFAGCASMPADGQDGTDARSGGRYHITRSEIEDLGQVEDAYQIVQRLRPQMLRSRGSRSTGSDIEANAPFVFVDDARRGSIGSLRSIPALQVREIRYIPARDATTRYGTGYPGGIIMVYTHRGK